MLAKILLAVCEGEKIDLTLSAHAQMLRSELPYVFENYLDSFRVEDKELWFLDNLSNSSKYQLSFFPNRKPYNFCGFPITTKRDLRSNSRQYFNNTVNADDCWTKFTSGSSGFPVAIKYHPVFHIDQLILFKFRMARLIGLKLRNNFQNRIQCVAIHDNIASEQLVLIDPTMLNSAIISYCMKSFSDSEYNKFINMMHLCAPTSLTLKPNILRFLVDNNEKVNWENLDLDYVICSGGHLDDALFSAANDIMKTNIINAYGLTETGLIAYSCEFGTMHLDPDIIVEIVDDQGTRLNSGETGNIIVSSLRNLALPLIRYNTGDIGSIHNQQCPCGCAGLTLHIIEGRVFANFILKNGSEFPTTQLNEIFDIFGFEEFQLSQITTQEFELKYHICEQKPFLESNFTNYLSKKIESDVYVKFIAEDIGQTEKFQRYRCDL